MSRFDVSADLEVELDLADGSEPVTMRLTGRRNRLRLEVSDPARLLTGTSDDDLGDVAEALARDGVSIEVVAPQGTVATVGDVRTGWLRRLMSGSRYVRVGRLGPAIRTRREASRLRAAGAPSLVPPGTPAPLLPTRQRRRVRTTHDPARAGHARLYLYSERSYAGSKSLELPLRDGQTTIGSGPDCDLQLEGLAETHVVVQHTRADEYVAVNVGPPGSLRANGVPSRYALLRTGVGLDVRGYRLNFVRDEHADHGRPYGGRVGGELGRQRKQAPRAGG